MKQKQTPGDCEPGASLTESEAGVEREGTLEAGETSLADSGIAGEASTDNMASTGFRPLSEQFEHFLSVLRF